MPLVSFAPRNETPNFHHVLSTDGDHVVAVRIVGIAGPVVQQPSTAQRDWSREVREVRDQRLRDAGDSGRCGCGPRRCGGCGGAISCGTLGGLGSSVGRARLASGRGGLHLGTLDDQGLAGENDGAVGLVGAARGHVSKVLDVVGRAVPHTFAAVVVDVHEHSLVEGQQALLVVRVRDVHPRAALAAAVWAVRVVLNVEDLDFGAHRGDDPVHQLSGAFLAELPEEDATDAVSFEVAGLTLTAVRDVDSVHCRADAAGPA